MPFKKGQSGNPGGRSKVVTTDGKTIRQLAREHSAEALETILNIMRDVSAPHAARLSAAQSIHDRGWGKPSQVLSGDEDGNPAKLVHEIILRGVNP